MLKEVSKKEFYTSTFPVSLISPLTEGAMKTKHNNIEVYCFQTKRFNENLYRAFPLFTG